MGMRSRVKPLMSLKSNHTATRSSFVNCSLTGPSSSSSFQKLAPSNSQNGWSSEFSRGCAWKGNSEPRSVITQALRRDQYTSLNYYFSPKVDTSLEHQLNHPKFNQIQDQYIQLVNKKSFWDLWKSEPNPPIKQYAVNSEVEKYRVTEVLESKGRASLYLGVNTKTEEKVVLKVTHRAVLESPLAHDEMIQEINLHKRLSHDNVQSLIEVLKTEQGVV